jgi:hypothetical protein
VIGRILAFLQAGEESLISQRSITQKKRPQEVSS